MQDQFIDFCNQIMQTEAEANLFQNLIVNAVMAPGLFDSDLKKLCKNQWSVVFNNLDVECSTSTVSMEDNNRCATIIIEHIIQAADVSHTMQHWHVYQECNRCLFEEMYIGYQDGHVKNDPSRGWYNGEL
jgi:hypothetical protein